jgi:hypothetical protein
MGGLNKREFLKRIEAARSRVNSEISGNAKGGHFAAGLSSEGYAGGYRDALNDVEALLRHGYPNDTRGYWRKP